MTQLGSLVAVNPDSVRLRPDTETVALVTLADIDTDTATVVPQRGAAAPQVGSGVRRARPGDVLFARISPSMENGKLAIVPELGGEQVLVSAELLVLRPRAGVDPRLVWAYLRLDSVRRQLRRSMIGTAGRLRLRDDVVERIEVPEVPAASWRRGVAVLERLDRARATLVELEQTARRIPAAVAERFAAGAPRAELAELAELSYGAGSGTKNRWEVAALRAVNIRRGRLDTSDLRFLPEPPGRPLEQLVDGDLLMAAAGSPENLGKSAVFRSALLPGRVTFTSSLIRIRPADLHPDFLWAWFQTEQARAELVKASRGRLGALDLGARALGQLAVPWPYPEQEALVAGLAVRGREISALAERQLALLDRALAAHLAAVFAAPDAKTPAASEATGAPGAPVPDPPLPQVAQPPPPPTRALPAIFAAASARQQELWRLVAGLEDGFGLADLDAPETERAFQQHTLAVLEQLGVVLRDSGDRAHRWRPPDPELELLTN